MLLLRGSLGLHSEVRDPIMALAWREGFPGGVAARERPSECQELTGRDSGEGIASPARRMVYVWLSDESLACLESPVALWLLGPRGGTED